MRGLIGGMGMLVLLMLAPASCKRSKNDDGPLSSVVKISNPHIKRQLTRGFFGVEVGAWSWTGNTWDARYWAWK